MASLLCLNKALILPREPSPKFRRPHFPLLPTPKPKALFVLGASGTGKSRLAIALALRFAGEVINSDKMQVYDALPITTNKVTAAECAGVPHHLLGGVHPDADFTAADFCREAAALADEIAARGRLPIIAGGSNTYVKELVAVDRGDLASRFDCCFVWVDVEGAVLEEFLGERVDKMVGQGLVEEARGMYDAAGDYTKGVRRAIGVKELDGFFRREGEVDEAEREAMMEGALGEIKENTCRLTRVQREKIRGFEGEEGWRLHRVDATAAVRRRGEADVWEETVVGPSVETVMRFVGAAATGFVVRGCGVGEENAVVGSAEGVGADE